MLRAQVGKQRHRVFLKGTCAVEFVGWEEIHKVVANRLSFFGCGLCRANGHALVHLTRIRIHNLG